MEHASIKNTGIKLRDAVKRDTEIVAACPYGGTCTGVIDGSVEWFCCSNYDGLLHQGKRCFVYCLDGK